VAEDPTLDRGRETPIGDFVDLAVAEAMPVAYIGRQVQMIAIEIVAFPPG
jgi:hypothetical protein